MGKPSPPPAPDYAAAAKEQGIANKEGAVSTASLSNPNIYSPYGNQTVSYANSGPDGNPQPTITQTLTPQAQQTLDAQQRVQLGLAELGQQGLGTAQNVLGQSFQYNGPEIQTSLPQGAGTDFGPSAGQYGLAQGFGAGPQVSAGPNAQRALDMSGVARMPVNAGTTGQAAILARLNPQIEQNRAATQQRLANQGLAPGGEAYDNEMRNQGNQENDLYSQAALQGIGLDMSANQQGYGQQLGQAGLYNQALGQDFSQNAAALGQNFSQGLQANQSRNSAIGQNYGQGATSAGLYNQASGQGFNQDLQAGQFGNQAALQRYQQQLAQYNQPLNQIAALMSGSQIQNPQFQQYTGSNVAAAPMYQAAQNQGQYAQNAYGQQMAGYNSMLGGLSSLGGAAFGLFGGGK